MKSTTYSLSEVNEKLLSTLAKEIKEGAVAIIPTDTIYGIVGSAKLPETIEKIYGLRKRANNKPMIILASSIEQITDLGIKITLAQKSILKKIWPNRVSVVLNSPSKKLHYLHRGKNSIAFRIPDDKFLLNFLNLTGPIAAPSANFEKEEPAKNISEAKNYFKDYVDFYIEAGDLNSQPSTLVSLSRLKLKILREGAVKIPKEFLQ